MTVVVLRHSNQQPRGRSASDKKADQIRAEVERLKAEGKHDEARRHIESKLPELDAKWSLHFLVELADGELAIGRAESALERAEAAVALRSQTPDPWSRISALATRANAYQHFGLLDLAYHDIQLAVEELRQLELAQAEDLKRVEDEKRAGKADARPKRLFKYTEYIVFKVQLSDVDIASSREDYKGTVRRVEAALSHPCHVSASTSSDSVRAQLRGRMGMALSELSRLDSTYVDEAREHLEFAFEHPALAPEKRAQFAIGLAELEWREGNKATSIALLEQIDFLVRLDHDFAYGLVAELHPMYQSFRSLRARQRFESESSMDLEDERELLAKVLRSSVAEFGRLKLRPGGYGFLQYPDRVGVLYELMRCEMRFDSSEAGRTKALNHLFVIGEATTLGRRLGAQSANVDRVRAELIRDDPEHAVLVYLPAATGTHVFLVTRDQVIHETTVMLDAIELARVEALDSLREPLPAGARPEAGEERIERLAKLASALFPEKIREHLSACKRVTILSRDLLGETPFEVLELSPGKELGMTHAVTHAPSASVAIVLAKRARAELLSKATDRGAFALLALPTAAKLRTDRRELKPLLDVFGAEGQASWFGDDFDLARAETAMKGAIATLLYTHGERDWTRERSTVFVTQGGLGGADEIERMDISTLTILAICGGGNTVRRRGDGGAADLAGACFSGGNRSRCVIQCAVDLDALAAVEITTHLARGLKEGLDVAEAMRRARVAMSKSEKYIDPFHRMMYVVGAGHAPIFRP